VTVGAVHLLSPTTDPSYPQVFCDHPSNVGLDWKALGDCAENETTISGTFDIFLKADREVDAVWIAGLPPIVSTELRNLFETASSVPATYLPLKVNARPFWIFSAGLLEEALDVGSSQIRYSRRVPGAINAIEIPVWRSERIPRSCLFRIPQDPKKVWATTAVVAAYEESGCSGVSFYPRGEMR
jgi:hypothetical protein